MVNKGRILFAALVSILISILAVSVAAASSTVFYDSPSGTTFIESEDTEQVIYAGSGWLARACNTCSGGEYLDSNVPGDTAVFTFEGVSISVVFVGNYHSGIAHITIDGQPYPDVDLINNVSGDRAEPVEHVIAADLLPGQHTIEVAVSGQKSFNFKSSSEVYIGIDGFRYGNFAFGTIEGRVLDADGDGIYNADVEISNGSNVYTVHAGADGVFSLSGLQSGTYSLTASGPNYAPNSVNNIAVAGGEVSAGIDIFLPEMDGHGLYHRIYTPRSNTPVIQQPDDSFQINFKEDADAVDWSVAISTPFNTIELPLASASYDPLASWTLTVSIPANTPNELYDLTVSSNLSTDTQARAVQVVDEYDSAFYFVVLGDPQDGTVEPGQPTFNQIVDEINLIDPAFVLVVGDLTDTGTASEYESYLQAINRLRVPSFGIPGNHDLGRVGKIKSLLLWKQYIGKHYFSFDYGEYRLIGLDNAILNGIDPDKVDTGGYFADQAAWAQADLAAHQDSLLRFLFLHLTFNSGQAGDSLAQWKPAWMDELGVNMVFSGHSWEDRVEVSGATPVHWVETIDVIEGRYRLVRIENNVIGTYTYNSSPQDAIPYNNLHVDFSTLNDGTSDTVVATVTNHLQENFENALLRFVMPGGGYYETHQGLITQVVESDDGVKAVVYVSLDVPPDSVTTVTVTKRDSVSIEPANIAASDGDYPDRVEVVWDAVANAESYVVYRLDAATWVRLGQTEDLVFYDTTAEAWQTYEYKVEACHAGGCISNDNTDVGFRMGKPAQPGGVWASDGNSAEHVTVTWKAAAEVSYYEVYIHNRRGWNRIAQTTETVYLHTSAAVLVKYTYRIRACNAAGCVWSTNTDAGYRSQWIIGRLVKNAGMEKDNNRDRIPDGWIRLSIDKRDQRVCRPVAAFRGKCGFLFLGDSIARADWLRQDLWPKVKNLGGGRHGDILKLVFWARGVGLTDDSKAFVLLKVGNSITGDKQSIVVPLSGDFEYQQYIETLDVTLGKYNQVWVYVYFNGQTGQKLFVDNIQVVLSTLEKK